MGKGAARKSEALQSQAADRYSKMAEQLMTEATPQRQTVGNYYTGIIKGGPEAYRVAAPEVNFMKRQFQNARANVRDYVPRGGAQSRAYRDLAVQEPGAVSGVFQKKIEEALARLSNLATFNTQGTLSATGGISDVGGRLGELSVGRANAVAGGVGSIAQALGFMYGAKK